MSQDSDKRYSSLIAIKLGISEITIKLHRHQVMQKMMADSLAALVRMAEKLAIPATK